jgi:hypothetical protein
MEIQLVVRRKFKIMGAKYFVIQLIYYISILGYKIKNYHNNTIKYHKSLMDILLFKKIWGHGPLRSAIKYAIEVGLI